MSTSPHVQFAVQQSFQTPGAPKAEARALFTVMRRTGETPDDIRELILVPPETQTFFRSYVLEHPEERHAIERIVAFRRQVSIEFERLVESAGASVGSEVAVEVARDRLTPREHEVLRLISEGMSCRDVSSKLGVSCETVQTHRASIMRKLKLRDAADLAIHATAVG